MTGTFPGLSEESARLIDVITDAAWGAFRSEANGPEVAMWILHALDEAGFVVKPADPRP